MRIAYLSGSTIPSNAANSIQVMQMCEAFASLGHEVVLIAQAGIAQENIHEAYGVRPVFEVIRHALTGSRHVRQWRYGWQAVNEIRRRNPDVIYGRHLPGLAIASFLNTPLVYEVHQPATGCGSMLEAWLFRRSVFAQLTTISDALRREYLQKHPALAMGRVIVGHSAAKTGPPVAAIAAPLRGRKLRIGYTGHLYPGKGMETIAALAARLPSCEFHVIGGSQESVSHWNNQVLGFPNLKLHGHVDPCQVSEWQRRMDVLILPCQKRIHSAGGGDIAAWTSPLKLFEYMASGRPVVASDLPVLREVLCDGVNCLLVPPDDIEGWTNALQRLADPALRATLGQRGRQWVESGHTWSHRAQRVLNGIRRADDQTKAA